MTLKEYLKNADFKNKKVITWNVAGNKAVRHNVNVTKVTDNVYVGEIDKTDNYYYINCRLYASFGGIMFDIGYIDSEVEMDDLISRINGSSFVSADKYMENVYQRIEKGMWINLVEMEYIKAVNPEILSDVEKARTTWQKKLDDERTAEQNARNAEKQAEIEKNNAEAQKTINSAISIIKDGGTVKNDEITLYTDIYTCKRYSVIGYLFDKYEIKMPIRTKGFVINTLNSITVSADGKDISYSYWKKGNSKGSTTIYTYIYQLIEAIRNN